MKKIYSQRTCLSNNTQEIKVTAHSVFDRENSDFKNSAFVWLYNIKIENYTHHNIKLISGRWEVFDKYGKSELEDKILVSNPCVIKSTESFECTNIIRLFSDSGLIYGKYYFLNLSSSQEFTININSVSLDNNLFEKIWN